MTATGTTNTLNGESGLTYNGTLLQVTSAVSASSYTSSINNAVGFFGTASYAEYATTASYAMNGGTGASFPYTGSAIISGSLIVTGSITGSLFGTSSWAQNTISSSYAITASHALGASGYITFPNGLTVTGSTLSTGGFTGSLVGTASVATELVKQTISLSSSISQAFTNITSGSQHLSDGVYAISSVLNSPSLINYRLAGTFSWHTGSVSTSDIDEIFLHRTGQSASSASIFMRTNAISGSTTFLQIGSDYNLATGSYVFTLVKMI